MRVIRIYAASCEASRAAPAPPFRPAGCRRIIPCEGKDRPMRRYLITGAASGIGAACCRVLAGPGVAIALHTRKNREGAERMAAFVREKGGTAHVLLGDLAEPAAPARAVEQAVAALGGLDVL